MGTIIALYKTVMGRVDGNKSNLILLAILLLVLVAGMETPNGLEVSALGQDDLMKTLLVMLGGAGRSAIAKIGK